MTCLKYSRAVSHFFSLSASLPLSNRNLSGSRGAGRDGAAAARRAGTDNKRWRQGEPTSSAQAERYDDELV